MVDRDFIELSFRLLEVFWILRRSVSVPLVTPIDQN